MLGAPLVRRWLLSDHPDVSWSGVGLEICLKVQARKAMDGYFSSGIAVFASNAQRDTEGDVGRGLPG